MTTGDTFYCDKEEAKDDAFGNKVTIVRCHGRLVTETSPELKAMVKALIDSGGRIIVDLSDVSHLDSSGLGALVGLKASALSKGLCILEFRGMTPRVLELLRITKLTELFSSSAALPEDSERGPVTEVSARTQTLNHSERELPSL